MPEAVDPQEDRSVTGLSQLLFVHSESEVPGPLATTGSRR